MKNKKILLTLALSGLLLAACDNPTTSVPGSSSSTDNPSTSDTSKNDPSSSTPVAETYLVVLHNASGITLSADKTEAKKGETVTITVSIATGFTLLSLTQNGNPLTVTNNQASFVMPDEDVDVRCQSSVEGDITLGGSVAATFVEENGVYVAKNVQIATKGEVYVAVSNSEGTGYTPLGYNSINRLKTFADVTFANTEFGEASLPSGATIIDTRESLIEIAGNAIYDVYYDPANKTKPISFQRVGLLSLPDSWEDYYSLFDSSVGSDPATYPLNVKEVTYYDSMTKVDYNWKKYGDNTSYATATSRETGQKVGDVYKSIKNGVYTVVDTFIEKKEVANPYPYPSGGSSTIIVDDTKSSDSTRYSAEYDVVEEVESGYSKWQMTEEEAIFDANHYSHDIYAIDRMQWQAYRHSFDLEEDLTASDRKITSVQNDDGTFTTTIDSYKTYTPETSGNTQYNRMATNTHIEYDITVTFTAGGAPLVGSYLEKKYDATDFNFATGEFKDGGEEFGGTVVKKVDYEYKYGEAYEGAPSFDSSKYFASAIEVTLPNGGLIKGGWKSNSTDEDEKVTIRATGENASTALDIDQYAVVGSDDLSLFAPSVYSPTYYEASTANEGTTMLTFGKHLKTKSVTTKVEATIASAPFRSLYINPGYTEDWHIISATSFQMYGNTTWTAKLSTSGPDGDTGNLSRMEISYSVPNVITATVDPVARTVTFVTGNVTAETIVNITFDSPYYKVDDDGHQWGPTTFQATIAPSQGGDITAEGLIGSYKPEVSSDSLEPDTTAPLDLTLTDVAHSYVDSDSKTYRRGSVAITANNEGLPVGVWNFAYNYNENTNAFLVRNVVKEGSTESFRAVLTVEPGTGKVGIALYSEAYGAEDGEITYTYENILGTMTDIGEGQAEYTYIFFVKVS